MKIELTNREREILPLLALPYKEIAVRLCVSSHTIKTHANNILYKFPEQNNKLSVILEALKQGIITLDEIVTE